MGSSAKTCEFVSPRHPDKICDFIADAILDAYLSSDRESRVAIEVLGGHGVVTVSGEVTSRSKVNIPAIVHRVVGKSYRVAVHVVEQSPFIAHAVDRGGAGDQGIMVGYAVRETKSLMPREYVLARDLCRNIYARYPYDGKVQVTLDGDKPVAVVASFQKTKTKDLLRLVRSMIKAEEYFINPAGEWPVGGFEADSGLSGRKIVIDNYGPEYPVGGGSFSGKDPTKVDRSGAYMARRIAVDLLLKRRADFVKVKLAYVIGKEEPVMASAFVDGREEDIRGSYDLSPQGIIKALGLRRFSYAKTSQWGHFGRGFPWDIARGR
jgi:S-adenosylmethionine synthetase